MENNVIINNDVIITNNKMIIEEEIKSIETSFLKNKISYEHKFSKKNIKKIKDYLSEEFKLQYKNYKISVKMLLDDGDHFKLIREICTKSEDDYDIWNSEHFDFVQKNLIFFPKIYKLITLGFKLNLITKFERNMLKEISPNVNSVWKLDNIFVDFYLQYDYDIPTYQELEYFFAFIDIILFKLEKINIIKKENYKNKNTDNILDDSRYLGCVLELKNYLEKDYIKEKLRINNLEFEESW